MSTTPAPSAVYAAPEVSATLAASTAITTTTAAHARVAESLARQGMMQHLGVRLVSVGAGEVTLALPYSDRVTQQQGGYHGGALGALADIAGGYAGLTVAPEGMEVTTVEFKINFLNACQGGELLATGRVVKAGKRTLVTSADVTHVAADGRRTACAVMQQTLMAVPKTY
jgi:uncharacterized protein (TIGR00369 family)